MLICYSIIVRTNTPFLFKKIESLIISMMHSFITSMSTTLGNYSLIAEAIQLTHTESDQASEEKLDSETPSSQNSRLTPEQLADMAKWITSLEKNHQRIDEYRDTAEALFPYFSKLEFSEAAALDELYSPGSHCTYWYNAYKSKKPKLHSFIEVHHEFKFVTWVGIFTFAAEYVLGQSDDELDQAVDEYCQACSRCCMDCSLNGECICDGDCNIDFERRNDRGYD